MIKAISELGPDELVDLELDMHADPNGDNVLFHFEYSEVIEIEHETIDCTVVHFSNPSVGFPPRHEVRIANE